MRGPCGDVDPIWNPCGARVVRDVIMWRTHPCFRYIVYPEDYWNDTGTGT